MEELVSSSLHSIDRGKVRINRCHKSANDAGPDRPEDRSKISPTERRSRGRVRGKVSGVVRDVGRPREVVTDEYAQHDEEGARLEGSREAVLGSGQVELGHRNQREQPEVHDVKVRGP